MAMRAYRARNAEALKAKARERMARCVLYFFSPPMSLTSGRRRQKLSEDSTARADYHARARASSQRYRDLCVYTFLSPVTQIYIL
jgi:hypothetical protein